MSQLNWTEAQWNRVNSAITEEFTKASVAGACLPCYGPVAASTEAVSKQQFAFDPTTTVIDINDNLTTPFRTIRVYVSLNSEQVADENLSSALFAFKRAANLLARMEDYLVFVGQNASGAPKPLSLAGGGARPNIPSLLANVNTSNNLSAPGLLTDDDVKKNYIPVPPDSTSSNPRTTSPPTSRRRTSAAQTSQPTKRYGESLVTNIAVAITDLEKNGYPGPFACVLGQKAFVEAHTPSAGSLVLPADRITPMLGGPLLRSGSMPPDHGVVASSCGESIDIVVATPPKAQFLQITGDAKYAFRVYERFILRIKDPNAVVPFKLVD
jgi:uncharacterized linocin/CFP29 family protein